MSDTQPTLSGCIIARDEADRIGRALASLAFCTEIVVLDSGSTDGTVEIAEGLGARVVRTDWPGHVEQKNRAIAACTGDWVLSLDADEWVPAELCAEIQAFIRRPTADSASMPRRNIWLGTVLRHGRWYPDRRVRLARRQRAIWAGTNPHDRLEAGSPANLQSDLVHEPYRDLREHLSTIDRYTTIAARTTRPGFALVDLGLRPVWHFLRAYVLEMGFRDGLAGLVVAWLGSLYVVLKYARARGLVMGPAAGDSPPLATARKP